MGRGLSDLQRWILARADQNADRGYDACVTFEEVKTDYYSMPRSRTTPGWSFRKKRIARYNAVSAAVSKAARRLADRGLAKVTRGSDHAVNVAVIELTNEGILVAEKEQRRSR